MSTEIAERSDFSIVGSTCVANPGLVALNTKPSCGKSLTAPTTQGRTYSAVNCARSALSSNVSLYVSLDDGSVVSKEPAGLSPVKRCFSVKATQAQVCRGLGCPSGVILSGYSSSC